MRDVAASFRIRPIAHFAVDFQRRPVLVVAVVVWLNVSAMVEMHDTVEGRRAPGWLTAGRVIRWSMKYWSLPQCIHQQDARDWSMWSTR